MKALDHLYRLFLRLRYPASLPEDIAEALGIRITNFITFNEFVNQLVSPTCRPTRLRKFMSRDQAEQAFHLALRKEQFKHNSLFSFYFNEGWMEFVLFYDDQSRLRRLYLRHKQITEETGIEILLSKNDDEIPL